MNLHKLKERDREETSIAGPELESVANQSFQQEWIIEQVYSIKQKLRLLTCNIFPSLLLLGWGNLYKEKRCIHISINYIPEKDQGINSQQSLLQIKSHVVPT